MLTVDNSAKSLQYLSENFKEMQKKANLQYLSKRFKGRQMQEKWALCQV